MKPNPKNISREDLYTYIRTQKPPLSESLRLLRTFFGWTQKETAQRTGTTVRIISDIEHGKGNQTLNTINKIFKPFGLEIMLG